MDKGSLTVVGTGYQPVAHATLEAIACIECADKVFYLVANPVTEYWLKQLNPNGESLHDSYGVGKPRGDTYSEMAERLVAPLADGLKVCAVFYGHPGVFVNPSHVAIRQARLEGYEARMLPGISAEDCLFADVGLDPGLGGCQSFEATNFLIRQHVFDTSAYLILWQIGLVGVSTYEKKALWSKAGLAVLVDYLVGAYSADHEAVVYEAAQYPVCEPTVERLPLSRVPEAGVTVNSTLCVPPAGPPTQHPAMLARLGMTESW